MRKTILVLGIVGSLLSFILTKSNPLDNDQIMLENYKIVKLDSIDSVYLIYAERNDSVFKIMSKKENIANCRPIVVGESYKLNIVSWFLPEEFHVKMRTSGVKFNNILIEIERNSIVGDLFTSENLLGKCYIELPE